MDYRGPGFEGSRRNLWRPVNPRVRGKTIVSDVIERLFEVLKQRRHADPAESYVAGLHQAGLNRILEKVGEESTETIIAAKDAGHSGDTTELIKETADLWFHTLVMLEHLGEHPENIFAELEHRFGTSGISEKNNRNK